MKIAQIAPLIESVPPRLYGGTERIVSYLTEALVQEGHEVTLFASGDSRTSAELVACVPDALRLAGVHDTLAFDVIQLEQVRQRADAFDILHFHNYFVHFPLAQQMGWPALTTMHGRLDLPGYAELFTAFAHQPVVTISNSQQNEVTANWAGVVPHGVPKDLYAFSPDAKGGYLAFLGRVSKEKGPARAIEIARRTGIELKIAAKIGKEDEEYYDTEFRFLLDDPLVDFVGEIGEDEKSAFLGGARALLFPVDWPEPFGLAMIEAMACGTPVIAWPNGAVPEVVDEGVTGFMVDTVDAAAAAVANIGDLDRSAVRRRFEERFTDARMARDYVRVYESLRARRRQRA